MRKIVFLISLIVHVLFFLWFTHVQFSLRTVFKERVVHVRLVPPEKINLPWEMQQPKNLKQKRLAAPSTEKPLKPENPLAIEEDLTPGHSVPNTVPIETPLLETPKNISPGHSNTGKPNLSIYSSNMKSFLNDFDRNRKKGMYESEISGTGITSVTIDKYDMKPWAKRVLLSIQRNWIIPAITPKPPEGPVEVEVTIEKTGKIISAKIKNSSSVDMLDQAALTAMQLSSPFPPMPGDFPEKSFEACFRFVYDVK